MIDEDSYFTILETTEGLHKEKGSRFLAFAHPVTSEAEIKEHLAQLKKKYFDATHHCYAYILGPNKEIYKANDAGEPSHTAGDPILNQIKSKNLTDTLVVVVRYFGGTKLGASGLTSAYKAAANEVLSQVEVVEKMATNTFVFTFQFQAMNEVMRIIKRTNASVLSRDFTQKEVTILIEVTKSHKTKLETELRSIHY